MARSLKEKLLQGIPPAYRHQLVNIKNGFFGGYRHYYYSQFGEDIIVSGILREKVGFYVDVGAHHPKRYSNTQLLYERGWRGINIDPNAQAIYTFNHARPQDKNLCMGVGHQEGNIPYYRFSDPAYNTFSKKEAEALSSKRWLTALPTEKVPVLPLADILRTNVPEGVIVDFLNVDAEGMDLEVLHSNDWGKFFPNVVAVETSGFTFTNPSANKVYDFLNKLGYALEAKLEHTLIFVSPTYDQ